MARQDWPDGTVRYLMEMDLHGTTSVTARTYRCPQPGLRKAHGSNCKPITTGTDETR
ncbi:hypothetical protein ACWDQO_26970 [Streptomyces sp. NPDC003703]|uniref:hypothetical protein n=1 Tax=Streptomyces sp. NPDC003283 TaxID=3364681 RepID=UPI0036CC9C80